MLRNLTLALCTLVLALPAYLTPSLAAAPDNTLVIELSNGGKVEIELLPELAPNHVERIKTLASGQFYDGIVFHRVIPDFMAQTGDPDGNGQGGSKLPDLNAEFHSYPFKRGTVGAARTQDPDSANSQFFICYNDKGCAHLTGQYTVWGQVTSGMEHIDTVAGPQDRMTKVYLKSELR
jgi:peptidylprolyl isomerase